MSTQIQHNGYDYSDWRDAGALAVRRQWMLLMGFEEEEINEHCSPATPVNFDEELHNYNAMMELEEIMRKLDGEK
jgi:hypothetical protein